MSQPALQVLDGGRAPQGWEELWARDEWRQSELPHGDLAGDLGGETILRFDRLTPPWLQEAAKRWARARLLGSTAPQSMKGYLSELRAFCRWRLEHAPEAATPAAFTRELLTDYVLFIRTSALAPSTQQRRVGVLRAFVSEQRDDGLTGLPRGAVIHAAEIPNVDYRLPRQLEPGIFEQFIDPANLARLSEQHRTIVLLLATTGLRVSSVSTLARDALEIGSDHHPYLRYRNHKLRREAMLPIGPTLVAQLARQQEHLAATYGPTGTDWLLPCPIAAAGPAGSRPVSRRSIAVLVKSYVRKADIRDSDGQLASWVHPHLFRHHLATSLLNDGVALPVIQKLLDHASVEMTARYAHLHDDTLRHAITRWHERINIRGERIALPTAGPQEEAAWMKDRIAHARQALPNGYCGLPARPDLPTPKRLPQLRQLPHRQLLPAHPRRAARAHPDHARRRPRTRRRPPRRNARRRPAEPYTHPRRPRRPRGAARRSARSDRPRRASRQRRVAMNHADHAHALADAAAHRTLDAEDRVRRTLTQLDREGADVTFAAVARHARVSRQFLYSHDAVRAEIATLRAPRADSSPRIPARERASENSLRARLHVALDDNHRLRSELTQLRDELANALGRNRESELEHHAPQGGNQTARAPR